MHAKVKTAFEILAASDSYPEVIVALAQEIASRHKTKSAAIVNLWAHRSMWRVWLRYRQQSKLPSYMARARYATTMLRNDGYTQEQQNVLHIGKQHLGSLESKEPFLFDWLTSGLKLMAMSDLTEVNRYYRAVNAKRYDPSLESVGFLRGCSLAIVAEILTWKALNEKS